MSDLEGPPSPQDAITMIQDLIYKGEIQRAEDLARILYKCDGLSGSDMFYTQGFCHALETIRFAKQFAKDRRRLQPRKRSEGSARKTHA